jgi:hypothetical protein
MPAKQRLKLWLLITLSCVALGPPLGAVWYSMIAAFMQPSSFAIIILAVPFSYFYGGIPALLGGGAYALCVSAFSDHIKFLWWKRMLLGMLLGGLACMVFLAVVPIMGDEINGGTFLYVGCGVFAGAICAWRYRLAWIESRLAEPKA